MQDFEGMLTFCDLNRLSREAWQIETGAPWYLSVLRAHDIL